jgi:hypothetical protein
MKNNENLVTDKFKAGDKVIKIAGGNFFGLDRGKIYTVSEVSKGGGIKLSDWDSIHGRAYFLRADDFRKLTPLEKTMI